MVTALHVLEFITVAFALGMACVTGNYLRIRWYLGAMLLYKVATQGWLIIGSRYDPAYFAIYAVGTLAFLTAAAWVALEAVEHAPKRLQARYIIAPAACGIFVILSTLYSYPELVIMTLQSALYLIVGAPTWATAEIRRVTPSAQGSAPYAVLGRFWMAMSLLCLLYVTGMVYYPETMYGLGEWILTVPVVVTMPILGWSFHASVGLAVHARSRG